MYFIGAEYYWPVLLCFALASGFYYFLSRSRKFYWSLSLMLFTVLANTFWGSLETPKGGIEFFLIPLSLVPFVVLENKKICIAFVVLSIFTLLLSHFLKKTYVPRVEVSAFYAELTYLLVLVGVFILMAIIILQFRIVNSKYENIIRQQKAIVESKNKDIVDSITYARRIQNSIIPAEKQIQKILSKIRARR
jgi:hypothetical protein